MNKARVTENILQRNEPLDGAAVKALPKKLQIKQKLGHILCKGSLFQQILYRID